MNELSNKRQAIELLQELGLKEYEAKCFVALSRLPQGTAKEISEISDVPRTRVYDATRVLESKGLVEVQHSSPQRFRSVGMDEAVETLRQDYSSRMTELRDALEGLNPVEGDRDSAVSHEVWSLSGDTTIATRARSLVEGADREVMLVLGDEAAVTEGLLSALEAAIEDEIPVIVGTLTTDLRDTVEEAVPGAEVFVSELDWLQPVPAVDDHTAITRMLLVDREAILVSTAPTGEDADERERAIFGGGFTNGIVVIARRLMATGLLEAEDPTEPLDGHS